MSRPLSTVALIICSLPSLYSQESWNPVEAVSVHPAIAPASPSGARDAWQPIGPNGHDILDFAFNRQNPRVIYAASRDSGVFRTTDGGASWRQINTGITNLFIRAIETHPTDSNVILAGSFHGGIFWTGDGGNSWYPADSYGDSTILSIAFDELHPDTVYAGTNHDGVYRSTSSGTSWQRISPDSLGNSAFRVLVDAGESSKLTALIPDTRGVYTSDDFGATWSRLYSGKPIISLASNPLDLNTIYIGSTLADSIYLTRNAGGAWHGVPPVTITTDLAVNPADTAQIFAGSPSAGVYRSTNSGASWNLMSTGLSSVEVLRLRFEPGNPSVLYASTNGGAICKTGNLITSVRQAPGGRPHETELLQNYPNPFNPSTSISFNLRTRVFVTLRIFDMLGREVSTLVSQELSAGTYSREWHPGNIPSGTYFYRLTAGSFSTTKSLVLIK